MRIYLDSDILIWQLRGEARAALLLRRLAKEPRSELWTGALQRAEITFHMRPHEASATMSLLAQFKTEAVTQEIVDLAAAFFQQWRPSHGIDVADAILAATVATTGGKLYTQNRKHFPMPDVAVLQGWAAEA